MTYDNICRTLRDEAQLALDRGVITRGQRIVIASLMRDAADELEKLDAADCECHLCMYLEAQKRYMALTDAVFEKLAHGDVHGVIQFAMEMADGCGRVDDELAEVATRAAQRFSPEYIFGSPS